jgi:hypothetical protein
MRLLQLGIASSSVYQCLRQTSHGIFGVPRTSKDLTSVCRRTASIADRKITLVTDNMVTKSDLYTIEGFDRDVVSLGNPTDLPRCRMSWSRDTIPERRVPFLPIDGSASSLFLAEKPRPQQNFASHHQTFHFGVCLLLAEPPRASALLGRRPGRAVKRPGAACRRKNIPGASRYFAKNSEDIGRVSAEDAAVDGKFYICRA